MVPLLTELGVLDPLTGAVQWRPRGQVRRLKRSADGRQSLGVGVRVGYWPCLNAPYVHLTLGPWRVEGWIGLPSYQAVA